MIFLIFTLFLNVSSETIITYDNLMSSAKKHLDLNNFDEALAMANKARVLKPSSYDVFNLLGLISYNKNEFKESISYFKKANSIKKSASTYYNIGLAYSNLGDYKKSIVAYEKSTELDPGYKNSIQATASLYLKLKDVPKAINLYKTILETDPSSIDALVNIACLYAYNTVDLSELKIAQDYLNKAKTIEPENARLIKCLEIVDKNILAKRK